MIHTLISKLSSLWNDLIDRLIIVHKRHTEIVKFKDSRRESIYKTVELTEGQKSEIDLFFTSNYGRKVPYVWHRYYTAFTGHFDSTYMPELLYIPEFERFMNPLRDYVKVFGDKNILPYVARANSVRVPKVFLSSSEGFMCDEYSKIYSESEAIERLSDLGPAFIKPSVDSSSGRGCAPVDFHGGKDVLSGSDIKDILHMYFPNFVLQERLKCSKSISELYPNSVNTFRIITYRWKDSIFHCPAIMRIGKNGAVVDNAHAGGIFIGVSDDGVLCDTAYTEFNQQFSCHPDTGVRFGGYRIPGFSNVITSAIKMHSAIPQIGLINWDFTLDTEDNPVLIEANTSGGSVWLIEIAHGCCAFGEMMPEILQWMRKQKKMSYSKRAGYRFGHIQ